MLDDEQAKGNFRVSYYEKVGFRGSGEKALVAILKDDVIEQKKLENFCVRFPLPSSFRVLIWEILLQILPLHQQSHKFVMHQRTQHFEDLQHALEIMKKIDSDTELPVSFLKMHFLETGKLYLKFKDEEWHKFFYAVGNVVCDLVDSPVIAYWITVNFHKFFMDNNYTQHTEEFNAIVMSAVKKENPPLYTKLCELELFTNLPVELWYKECYARVIPVGGGIERVWDILIGKACQILPCVAVQILLVFDRQLMHCTNLSSCIAVLNSIPFSDETGNLIVGKGIELWKKLEKIS
ncbi:TBC1 domain family member 7-like [Ciona intestinalis]